MIGGKHRYGYGSRVPSHLRRAQYQVLVLLLALPNRLVERYHKRHVALVRLLQQEQLRYVVVLDLVVVPAVDRIGLGDEVVSICQKIATATTGEHESRLENGSRNNNIPINQNMNSTGETSPSKPITNLEPCIRMKWLYISTE